MVVYTVCAIVKVSETNEENTMLNLTLKQELINTFWCAVVPVVVAMALLEGFVLVLTNLN